jgi:tetratricopeptide (TPR) repeat protein
MEAEVANTSQEPFRHAQLGLLYAFLRRKEDALRAGRRAVELWPIEKDAIYGAQMLGLLAVIYAWTGERDQALDLVERLLVTPAAVLPAFEGSITLAELRLVGNGTRCAPTRVSRKFFGVQSRRQVTGNHPVVVRPRAH